MPGQLQRYEYDGDESPRTQPAAEAAPTWITQELIEQTIRVFGPYYGPLTKADAIEIIYNAARLIDVLA